MESRLTLAIEASNPSATRDGGAEGEMAVALGRVDGVGAEVLGAEPIRDTGRHDDDLVPAIARLFERTGRRAAEVELVAVSIGPGGYTGLRIAVTVGKMIAEVAGAEGMGVPTALVVAQRVEANGAPFAVALNSKRDSAYVTIFDAKGAPQRAALMTSADFGAVETSILVADAYLPDGFVRACEARSIAVVPPTFDVRALLECAADAPVAKPAELAPLYGREPDAVTQWRARHG